jgi:hypothetical protein
MWFGHMDGPQRTAFSGAKDKDHACLRKLNTAFCIMSPLMAAGENRIERASLAAERQVDRKEQQSWRRWYITQPFATPLRIPCARAADS